jgi:hypothetical protein
MARYQGKPIGFWEGLFWVLAFIMLVSIPLTLAAPLFWYGFVGEAMLDGWRVAGLMFAEAATFLVLVLIAKMLED